MRIIGIDPGTARIGWAVIDVNSGNIEAVIYGCIETQKNEKPEIRLQKIYNKIREIYILYKPESASVEDVFFESNAKTAIAVGQARGVILLACAQSHISVVSYSPLTIKRTITGNGKADKNQVQRMVQRLLKLKSIPKPDDTSDALAIALTHAYSYKLKSYL